MNSDLIKNYIELFRLKSPTGYMLLFLPCSFGIALNFKDIKDFYYLALYFIGAIVMRSAGCALNDAMDKNFDKMIARTKNRPIASGKLSVKSGYLSFVLLSFIGLIILIQLSWLSIIIGIMILPLVIIYPLTKRWTNFPQVVLGLVFNIGILIASANIKNHVDFYDIVLYIGCVFWTLTYDSIYAFMDYEDDIKIGVKSLAVFLRDKNYRLWLIGFHFIFLFSIAIAGFKGSYGFLSFVVMVVIVLLSIYDLGKFNADNKENCMKLFKKNWIIGTLVFILLI